MNKHSTDKCPLAPIVELFGGRWKTEILWRLEDGPKRFNQLRRLVPAVSQKMLTQQLRQLERDGVVRREHFPEIPPRVEYSMTPLGSSLQPLFAKLSDWGVRHLGDVLDAREHYDANVKKPHVGERLLAAKVR
jgi:DNA-binding HxlR family transcriptional regulator